MVLCMTDATARRDSQDLAARSTSMSASLTLVSTRAPAWMKEALTDASACLVSLYLYLFKSMTGLLFFNCGLYVCIMRWM